MEIQALKLVVTDQDLNQAAALFEEQIKQVSKLNAQITPDGVFIGGVYQMIMGLSFDTLWQLAVRGGHLTAQLTNFNVVGFGGGVVKKALLTAIAEGAKKEAGVHLEGDTLWVDLETLLAKRGFAAKLNLTQVLCEAGRLVLEAGGPDRT